MNGYLIALVVFLAWCGGIYFLHRKKWLEKFNMSLYGPFIMWKTKKGRDFIERVARHKTLWNIYGMASLWICAGAMFTMMLLLLWEATIVTQMTKAPSPELILGIPGLNPVIPVGYGILGLVVAIVVHELSHGIMSRRGEIKVRSLGLVFLVFPMGAFVEPDEAEIQTTTRRRRAKLFAAGPASNMIVAMVFLSLFSGVMMSSLEPTTDGALVLGVIEESPAGLADISPSSVITSINGSPIESSDALGSFTGADPGSGVTVQYYLAGELVTASNLTYGVVVSYAVEGYAAYEHGFEPGMVLVSLNDTEIRNSDYLSDAMAETSAGQAVNVTVMRYFDDLGGFFVDPGIDNVVLSNKHDYYEEFYPDDNKLEYDGVGYLGAGFLLMGVNYDGVDYYMSTLANPFEDDADLHDFSMSWLRLIALPFLDLAPIRSPVTDLYTPSGSMDWMPDSAFWLVTNSLYWIFWLNLMVGLTNVLPAVPLDGGYIFRDGLDYLISRVKKGYGKEQREKMVGSVTMILALFVLTLILWQIVGPMF